MTDIYMPNVKKIIAQAKDEAFEEAIRVVTREDGDINAIVRTLQSMVTGKDLMNCDMCGTESEILINGYCPSCRSSR